MTACRYIADVAAEVLDWLGVNRLTIGHPETWGVIFDLAEREGLARHVSHPERRWERVRNAIANSKRGKELFRASGKGGYIGNITHYVRTDAKPTPRSDGAIYVKHPYNGYEGHLLTAGGERIGISF